MSRRKKNAYTEEIHIAAAECGRRPFIYVVDLGGGYRKFGISTQCGNRLKTHYRNLKFIKIVRLFDCTYDSIMLKTETLLKRITAKSGERVTMFGETEVLFGDDIDKHLSWIENNIKKLLLVPQPPNYRRRDNQAIVKAPVVIPMVPVAKPANIPKTEFKCCDCDAVFTTKAHLDRHKDRKTPCLIKKIAPENIANPNRCMYCNTTLSKKEHLTRHLKTCKIKKRDDDLNPHEANHINEVRLLKEKDALRDLRERNLMKTIVAMQAKIEQLEIVLNTINLRVVK